jgi:hypothetical protein
VPMPPTTTYGNSESSGKSSRNALTPEVYSLKRLRVIVRDVQQRARLTLPCSILHIQH